MTPASFTKEDHEVWAKASRGVFGVTGNITIIFLHFFIDSHYFIAELIIANWKLWDSESQAPGHNQTNPDLAILHTYVDFYDDKMVSHYL